MSKAPYVFPTVGGIKVEHLRDNIQALKIRLTPEEIAYLENVKPFNVGFPSNFLSEDPHATGKTAGLLASLSWVRWLTPIGYEGR
jgi:diketogulonate reductase-like aldo/keto reductase